MDEFMLNEFESMWGSEREDYMLIEEGSASSGAKRYSIMHMSVRMAVIIDDPELAEAVKQRMLDAGVAIGKPEDLVGPLPRLRKKIRR